MKIEKEIQFEELPLFLLGKNNPSVLIEGYALLEGDEDGFSVTSIWLHGELLRPSGNGVLGFPAQFEDELFKRIASVIENPKTAVGAYAEREFNSLIEDMREAA